MRIYGQRSIIIFGLMCSLIVFIIFLISGTSNSFVSLMWTSIILYLLFCLAFIKLIFIDDERLTIVGIFKKRTIKITDISSVKLFKFTHRGSLDLINLSTRNNIVLKVNTKMLAFELKLLFNLLKKRGIDVDYIDA